MKELINDNHEPAPKLMFPAWRAVEQDFWLDMLESFSLSLLDLEELAEAGVSGKKKDDEYYIDKIRLAGKLADRAVMEMQYRFYRQRPVNTKKRRNDRHREDGRRPSYAR